MGNIAIRVENLGKMYYIGGPQERYRTFRDMIVRTVAQPVFRMRDVLQGRSASNLKEEVWALKDVSFEVKHGEVIGIIGRNGAGKSTLLKILSLITDPTTGYAEVYGRIGALLEVGTGFHPELTGRENVYLNGAILGMSRRDIDRKFDEIVAFSGIGKFIDTPVKHFSSGMGLRLGFSVAAHLEPEILVVDEVLAVGDAEFQQKCLGKMSDVASEGRTVLFVSHNLLAVRHLCSRGFYLKNGQLDYTNDIDSVVDYYLRDAIRATSTADLAERTDRTGGKIFRFLKIELLDTDGNPIEFARAGESMQIRAEYMHTMDPRDIRAADFFVRIDDTDGPRLFTLATQFTHTAFEGIPTKGVVTCCLDKVPLVPGKYSIALSGSINGKSADFIENALDFMVEEGDVYGTGRIPVRERNGVFIVTDYRWSLN